jgi:ubiquinone/menaquinone biosynthesis C-methylase UbiE
LCLGCGNPVAIADLRPGEAVLDLGCGGGLDVFLAATRVGPGGRVVGVDASPEMVARARSSAARTRLNNVRFGEGSIEKLPFGAGAFDVVLSNCVINHCPDPGVVFREARRVLRPRGRLCVTDLVTAGGFPAEALNDRVWGEWLRGAANRADYLAALASAGFPKVTIVHEGAFAMSEQDPALQGHIISLAIRAEG